MSHTKPALRARCFELHRDTDETGVSGIGVVADGVLFPDGVVALRWRGGFPTSVVFHDRGIESVEAVHGHGGKTRIVWLGDDGAPPLELEPFGDDPVFDGTRALLPVVARGGVWRASVFRVDRITSHPLLDTTDLAGALRRPPRDGAE